MTALGTPNKRGRGRQPGHKVRKVQTEPVDPRVVTFRFDSRPYQRALEDAHWGGCKRAVAVWHRRAGKDITCWHLLLNKALQTKGVYHYYLPTYTQAKKILWDGLIEGGKTFRDYIPNELKAGENATELKIHLRSSNYSGNSIIQLIGSDDYNSIRGTNPIGCVFSEYSYQDPRAWDTIRPVLAENNGWAIFNYTPNGRNHGYDLYTNALENSDWFAELLTVDDTGAISMRAIDDERHAGMLEEMVLQEFWCSFEAGVAGAFFARDLRDARAERRITSALEFYPSIPVHTFWDLGIGVQDSTAIWFLQEREGEFRLIHYHEDQGFGLDHYLNVLRDLQTERGFVYGQHHLPHDGANRDLSTGLSRVDYLRGHGQDLGDVQVIERPKNKSNAIEAVRRMLPFCSFDETHCKRGIDALYNYRREYNSKLSTWRQHPVHDWSSHGADALQTAAIHYHFLIDQDSFQPPIDIRSLDQAALDHAIVTGQTREWDDPFSIDEQLSGIQGGF